jgi:hypothetical protein
MPKMALIIAHGAESQSSVVAKHMAERSARMVAIQSMRYCACHKMNLAIAAVRSGTLSLSNNQHQRI